MAFSNRTRKWLRSGVEILIHGGAAALVSSFTAAQIDPKDWGWFSPNFYKMAFGTFMGSGGLRFLQWWSNNPLPPEGDTDPPFPDVKQPQISLNPLSKVVPAPKPDP